MDNLDRTNVAQAALAKWTLNKQLRELGILNENETIDSYDELIKDFRESESRATPRVTTALLMVSVQCGRTMPTRSPSRTAALVL